MEGIRRSDEARFIPDAGTRHAAQIRTLEHESARTQSVLTSESERNCT